MSASANLIDALKQSLKAQGMTYAKVARGLGMSEASVKRMFSRRDFTLKRLDKVLDLAGLELGELTRLVTSEANLAGLRKAAAEFAQMHNDDGGQPLKDRVGVSMLVAIRPWQLSAFGELRRRK